MLTGILGGSFNPVHNGHLSLARQMATAVGLDEVWLLVTPQNPLKPPGSLLADEVRLALVRQALDGDPLLIASDYEFHLPRPSYTWNTLQSLSADYPDRRFVLLIGGDNWELFPHWYHSDDILANYPVVVYPRENVSARLHHPTTLPGGEDIVPIRGEGNLGRDMLTPGAHFVNATLLDISSTMIRQRVSRRQSVSGLVPPQIEDLVIRLYSPKP